MVGLNLNNRFNFQELSAKRQQFITKYLELIKVTHSLKGQFLEIRMISKGNNMCEKRFIKREFFLIDCSTAAIINAYIEPYINDFNIYFGVNPRKNNIGGGRDNIDNIITCQVDLDFGSRFHTRPSFLKNKEQCQRFINQKLIGLYKLQPSIIIFTGNGYHLYYLLKEPVQNTDKGEGKDRVEIINKKLAKLCHGDVSFDISKILSPTIFDP